MNEQRTITLSMSRLAYMVVGSQILLAFVIIGSLCFALFWKTYSDPVVLTTLIGLAGILVGNIGSILGGPRMMMSMTIPTQAMISPAPEAPKTVLDSTPAKTDTSVV